MPELDWHWGYPLSIMLMALAAIGPYLSSNLSLL
jgi:Mg2+ and Co2+ transporter CorA